MPQGATTNDVSDVLRRAGVDDQTAEAVMRIDALMQNWRRRSIKRELGQRALVELKIGLELMQFDVLAAIEGSAHEFGPGAGETMVSTVAERLAIDPSRASRVVSEMVEAGYAQRAVSQADGRRAIVVLTGRGKAVVDAVRAYKYLIMGDVLGAWPKGELETFVPLLERFGRWGDNVEAGTERFAREIAELAAGIEAAGRVAEPV